MTLENKYVGGKHRHVPHDHQPFLPRKQQWTGVKRQRVKDGLGEMGGGILPLP